jgi:hypothetical protein
MTPQQQQFENEIAVMAADRFQSSPFHKYSVKDWIIQGQEAVREITVLAKKYDDSRGTSEPLWPGHSFVDLLFTVLESAHPSLPHCTEYPFAS